ncbi:hypothetical protein RQP46_010232 [Phenoliferia psychrophenolica]
MEDLPTLTDPIPASISTTIEEAELDLVPPSPSRCIADLPPETLGEILSYHVGQKTQDKDEHYMRSGYPTLLSACLVSKTWNAITTPILYRDVVICWDSRIKHTLLQTFAEQPHLLPLVRTIDVDYPDLDSCPNLTTLEVRDIEFLLEERQGWNTGNDDDDNLPDSIYIPLLQHTSLHHVHLPLVLSKSLLLSLPATLTSLQAYQDPCGANYGTRPPALEYYIDLAIEAKASQLPNLARLHLTQCSEPETPTSQPLPIKMTPQKITYVFQARKETAARSRETAATGVLRGGEISAGTFLQIPKGARILLSLMT